MPERQCHCSAHTLASFYFQYEPHAITYVNTKNVILVFSEKHSCSLKFSTFYKKNKLKIKCILHVFLILFLFENRKPISKICTKHAIIFFFLIMKAFFSFKKIND